MAKNFVDEGIAVTYKNTGTSLVLSGSVVVIGDRIGVVLGDVAPGQTITARIVGVFKLPKDKTTALSVGDAVFWDALNKEIVAAAGSDTVVAGMVAEDATASAAIAKIKINA